MQLTEKKIKEAHTAIPVTSSGKKNGKYTKVLRAGLEEDIKKPKWCGLKEV